MRRTGREGLGSRGVWGRVAHQSPADAVQEDQRPQAGLQGLERALAAAARRLNADDAARHPAAVAARPFAVERDHLGWPWAHLQLHCC